MPPALRWLLAAIALLGLGLGRIAPSGSDETSGFPRVRATEPGDVGRTFRTLHGFRMELLAAEPLVTDPVALEYDENGRAWVVEMRDYPYTDKSTDRPNVERLTDLPLGRVRILDDTDGDGNFDKSTVFAEDLSWPTGLALWNGGCYVTATPDVLYLKDTDGDGRADVRRKVFSGFKKLNVQAVINNPRWGLDHKLYCAGASNGGEITKPDEPAFKPVRFGRADFAFDPNSETFEVLTGGARFGQTFDDYGNRFVCNIRNPVQHVVFENRYLARNPYLVVTNAVHDCAEAGDTLPVFRASPPEPWRATRADRWRQEAGQTYPRSELAGEGYFTSACGITIYRGSAYPKEFYGNAFLGEVAGNLIHRETLTPDGVTFKAARSDKDTEFVASTDNWFRPVNFTNAPDGTLHVCDMYRETIEHPWSIPDDMKGVLDLESGRDRGRIYRLAPPGFKAPRSKPNLGAASPAQLVATLENVNGWWRDTAHRLIFERQDKAAVEPLRKLLRESKSELARIHAVWSLAGLGAIDQEDLLNTLHDPSDAVRRAGVVLAEQQLETFPVAKRRLLKMASAGEEGSVVVRFQLAFSLGAAVGPDVTQALTTLASGLDSDKRVVTAVLSSSAGRAIDLLIETSASKSATPTPLSSEVRRQLAYLIGVEGKKESIERMFALFDSAGTRGNGAAGTDELAVQGIKQVEQAGLGDPAMLAGLSEGLARDGKKLADFAVNPKTRERLQKVFSQAATTAANKKLADAERISAAQLLAQGNFEEARATLEKLKDPREPLDIQLAGVRGIAGFRDLEVPGLLLKNYEMLTPTVRTEIIESLASRPERVASLLNAIEAKQIAAVDVPIARRALLMKSKDPMVAARAVKLLTQSVGKRADIVANYRPSLQLAGDAGRGHEVYRRECRTCHRLREEGFDVGPNLATILHRSPDELMTHILDPNREVSPNYLEYAVVLDDGRTLTGLIAEETATSLTLRKGENVRQELLRSQIEEIFATGKSLMPEGLEQKLSPQDMADLLAFLLRRR
ncbi:MAG: dehydrogenase [Pirellula sp.]|nr:dehydrogenase [Pirellula sp.]